MGTPASVRYAVRVTGWSHGKLVSALCGNGRRWLTRDEAEAVAAASHRKLADEAGTLEAIERGAYDDRWIDATLLQKGLALR